MLALQGVGWLTRKSIRMSPIITLCVGHYDDDGSEHIDINQKLYVGAGDTTENRTLDRLGREYSDSLQLIGPVIGRSRRVTLDEISGESLKTGWTVTDVARKDGAISTYTVSDT